MPRIAAIDIGTNSFHMIISEHSENGHIKIIDKQKEIVRLGNSAEDMKFIDEDSMQRAISTLSYFANLAKGYDAKVIAVATSAVREANNANEFLSLAKKNTGIDVHLISGMEEARLIYTGVINGLPLFEKRILVIDIGGGSTETIVAQVGESIFARSVKIGTLRLTKKFFDKKIITDTDTENAREFVSNKWSLVLERLRKIDYEEVVVCSGTFHNIIKMTLQNKITRKASALNGQKFDARDILNTIELIKDKKNPERIAEMPGLDASRKDIMLAGALIVENIINELEIKQITYSSYALREGILYNIASDDVAQNKSERLRQLRNSTITNLCRKFEVDNSHSEHISMISEEIFYALEPLHKLKEGLPEILRAASMLHDCGFFVSHDAHHKHSYYLIAHTEMPGFTKDESEMIAQVARYHRKSMPKSSHNAFGILPKEKQKQIWVLGGILRIAEGIDRKQKASVGSVEVKINNSKIEIKLIATEKDEHLFMEIWSANSRKDMLSTALGRDIEIC